VHCSITIHSLQSHTLCFTFVLKLILARESHGSHVVALTLNKIVLVLCLILNSACDQHNAQMTYWCNCYHGNQSHEIVEDPAEVM